MEHTPHKCFRCLSEDNLIVKRPNPLKDNKERKKNVRFIERNNYASQKEYNNGENNNDQKIYGYMAHMSNNDECPSKNFSDS